MGNPIHVFFTDERQHDTEHGGDCWCEPYVGQSCPNCGYDKRSVDCDTCNGWGLVEPVDSLGELIIVHQQQAHVNG